ncbi:MAG: ABC transporter permease [Actinomycetaceae bacterium]|nr:ABC transporter permease [Actinomycetaceae bacterium]
MTTQTAHVAPAPLTQAPSPITRFTRMVRRIVAIGRAETLLFLRNPTILATALLMAPIMTLGLGPMLANSFETSTDGAAQPLFGPYLLQMLASWCLLMVVYYNLTTIFVARREDGVFQRMSTGEASSWEALVGAAIPSGIIALLQIPLGAALLLLVSDSLTIANILLPIIGILFGIIILTCLAAWCSTWTGTVEGAQYSTMPLLLVLMILSGPVVPFEIFGGPVEAFVSRTPLYAINDLITLGFGAESIFAGKSQPLSFMDTWALAWQPIAVLAIWTFGCVALARSTMKFARRR